MESSNVPGAFLQGGTGILCLNTFNGRRPTGVVTGWLHLMIIERRPEMPMKMVDLSQSENRRIFLKSAGLTRILDSWIDIHAPVPDVWAALVDIGSWGRWNAFIPVVEGELAAGKTLTISVVSPGMKAMTFKPEVYTIEEQQRISWGGGFLGFIYKGVHEFILEEVDSRTTRFRQIETFQGPIVLLMKGMIQKTALGYLNMNEAFKAYLEQPGGNGPEAY